MNRISRQIANPENLVQILSTLADNDVYASTSITYLAQELGLLDLNFSQSTAMRRLRITLNRLADLHAFPVAGDCLIVMDGKTPVPGWFGWRWKRLING